MFKILIFIFCFFSFGGFSQNLLVHLDDQSKNSKTETLKLTPSNNLLDLNSISNFSALSILDSAIYKNQVFFIGEDHRYRKS